jgi:RNA polymerase sigma-70 factor (ECF subfamily)
MLRIMDEIKPWKERAEQWSAAGAAARKLGEEARAEACFRQAFALASDATNRTANAAPLSLHLDALQWATRLALECGAAAEARRLLEAALAADASTADTEEWVKLRDPRAWPDAWLVAAVRGDPPDAAALDALADRHWKALFGRCQMLTVDYQEASDLAQQAWCRVLRTRHRLKPGGNIPAYLTTTATNLWRDASRSAKRAGPLADHRLVALDAALPGRDGDAVRFVDALPDLRGLDATEQNLLAMDLDQALKELSPLWRDVLVARYLAGESCAEIGRRHGRTEQTISAWVRQATAAMRTHLEELHCQPGEP